MRQHTHIHQPNKSTPLAAANASATAILRGHSLVDVAAVDDPATTVLYTVTVGALPGVAANVVVPTAAALVVG